MSTTQVPLAQATVTKDEATNLTVIEQCLVALAAALGSPAQQGGGGTPQANLATDGAGAWATAAIPAGTRFIDFLVDVAAYVVANAVATTPFGTNNGVPYQPNLNFRIHCADCTYLHIKGTGAAVHTLKWNAIA